MDDKLQGLSILDKTILNNLRHKDYERTVQLAQEYYEIFTGEGVRRHLRKITRREDQAMFEQRCNIYQTTIPSTVANLEELFNKPLRSNRIYSAVDHPDVSARNEILERMSAFYQGEAESGVDAYLAEVWKRLNVYDPNAFIAIEFADFDAVQSKPYPFPLEYSSKEAINYSYRNGSLEWIILQTDMRYRTSQSKPDEQANGHRYTLHLHDVAIVLTQVDAKTRITDVADPVFYEVRDANGVLHSVYTMQEFELRSQGIPLFRVGYKTDPVTEGRTCRSIIHAALPFFRRELKTGSEFDITMSMHAFPIRVQYGRSCAGDKERGIVCNNGQTVNGPCPVCKGEAMLPVATSAQDIIYVKPPKHKDEPVLDLEKAFIYKTPPADFVQFQEAYLDRLTQKAKGAVFAAEVVQQKALGKTATEMDYSYDNVYDTFHPFGQKYSYAWRFIVRQIAVYTDNLDERLVLYHQFPKDFKLKGLATLLGEAKLAAESGLSQHAISMINNDVLEALYADDQNTLTRIKVRDRFHPFSGKAREEVQAIMTSGDVLPYYRTLYVYFDILFAEIDNELGDAFYLWPYTKQRDEVKRRVELLMAQQGENEPVTEAADLVQTDAPDEDV